MNDTIKIYDYLNKPKYNRTLSEDDFQSILPTLVNNLFHYGFQQIIKDYNKTFLSTVEKDWKKLRNYAIETNNISAQSTTGLAIIKYYMTHIYDV